MEYEATITGAPPAAREHEGRESLDGSPGRRLRATGGGTVLEVEIRKTDDSVVEVMLDGNFDVAGPGTDD